MCSTPISNATGVVSNNTNLMNNTYALPMPEDLEAGLVGSIAMPQHFGYAFAWCLLGRRYPEEGGRAESGTDFEVFSNSFVGPLTGIDSSSLK